jgi:hypothetical protein
MRRDSALVSQLEAEGHTNGYWTEEESPTDGHVPDVCVTNLEHSNASLPEVHPVHPEPMSNASKAESAAIADARAYYLGSPQIP